METMKNKQLLLFLGIGLAAIFLFSKSNQRLSGGIGDSKKEQEVDQEELEMGLEIEMEHTADPEIAKEIALDHLSEDPYYYTHLIEMEKKYIK